jgi:hypothetical protein
MLPDHLGKQIGLPGSPASVLAAVAGERECVLVIDQLDAVSLASGRNPELFEVVKEMIRKAEAYPLMHLLLSCRKIDLDNDRRLRGLTREGGVAKAVHVGRLPETVVRQAVLNIGLDGDSLNSRQVRLLSLPLHLRLLEETSRTTPEAALDFSTSDDLFDEFWQHKRQLVRERLGGGTIRWPEVIDALCKRMSDDQILSVPADALDDYEDEAIAMASENVLALDGGQYAFFHEGFFDYAFARRFAERGKRLLPLLRESEQHLFRRAQVRQILRRERARDPGRYIEDLKDLLYDQDVRFHIKQVVFALLAMLEDPTPEEWEVLAPLIDGASTALGREVWGILRSSAAWFRVVDKLGLWERWLREDEERRDQVVLALYSRQKEESDRVAAILAPYFDAGDPVWRKRFAYLFRGAHFSTGRGMFDLFLRAIDGGLFDNDEFQLVVYGLAEEAPVQCSEALARFLRRRLELSIAANNPNPFYNPSNKFGEWLRGHDDERVFMGSARGAPREFAAQLLPFILKLAHDLMNVDGDPPWRDPVWGTRNYDQQLFTHDFLLAAMVEALQALAANEREVFDVFAQELRDSEAETAQYLLVRAYAADDEQYADEAAEYLLERPARLETGYAGSPYYATRELLQVVTPHCSDDKLNRLEELIMGYRSRWETDEDFRDEVHLTLLDAIDTSRRSEAVNRRVEELREKFGDGPILPPPPSSMRVAQSVESPIPQQEAVKLSDDEWLDAIARYPTARFD